jgi:NACalpha-BTF3-like transcription factor
VKVCGAALLSILFLTVGCASGQGKAGIDNRQIAEIQRISSVVEYNQLMICKPEAVKQFVAYLKQQKYEPVEIKSMEERPTCMETVYADTASGREMISFDRDLIVYQGQIYRCKGADFSEVYSRCCKKGTSTLQTDGRIFGYVFKGHDVICVCSKNATHEAIKKDTDPVIFRGNYSVQLYRDNKLVDCRDLTINGKSELRFPLPLEMSLEKCEDNNQDSFFINCHYMNKWTRLPFLYNGQKLNWEDSK